MKKWFPYLFAALTFIQGTTAAEDAGTASGVRKIGPEESKALLKDVGIVIKDKPTYPNVAYRLYPKPYKVFELATVGYSPFEQEDGSPLSGSNSEDVKIWGPDGEPVVILVKPGGGMWMEGFFSRKRVEVEPTRYAYRYSKIPNDQEDPGETVAEMNFEEPRDRYSNSVWLFSEDNKDNEDRPPASAYLRDRGRIARFLSEFSDVSEKNRLIEELLKEINPYPYVLGPRRLDGKTNYFAWCEPLGDIDGRQDKILSFGLTEKNKLRWQKVVMRYYLPEEFPPEVQSKYDCPVRRWLIGAGKLHLLPDGTVLTKLGTDVVVRLRWEDGEPVGPLPPFIKVVDAREVIWAKLDLLRRYRDEMKRRGIRDATELRTPEQIMHDLAAYFFDIREIRNWKEGGDK